MNKKLIVIKIGSHLIIKDEENFLKSIAQQVKKLKDDNWNVIIVSSGAIATGLKEYNITSKPKTIVEKQSYAAIGQPLLMNKYIEVFKPYNIKVAQVLLTREDFDVRQRHLNIKNTLNYLLKMDVVPIINENDTVAVEEIKVGDNDTLSAVVATKLDADLLVLLTDVDGVYDKDPNKYLDAKIIEEIRDIEEIENKCIISSKTKFFCGTGGMETKFNAAKICVSNGVEVVIANGLKENVVIDIVNGKKVGSRFLPIKSSKVSSKEKWIKYISKSKGKIFVDDGAVKAILEQHKSLLPVGIRKVEGKFNKGDVVSICSINGEEIARGVVNYSTEEVELIKQKKTDQIKKLYPQFVYEEVVHANNMVVVKSVGKDITWK
jgi:glutamate 5-kinase